MSLLKKAGVLAFSLFISTNTIAEKVQFDIPQTSGNIEIDGELNEAQWQHATKVNINNVVRPFDNTPSPVKTEALVMQDGETFYIAFIAHDPNPENIRAHYKDRDNVWGDDLVGVKIDTYNDSRLAYQFWVNPVGVQNDSIENEMTKRESSSWNAIWSSYGKINENGYVVEMALPLRILNFNESLPIQTWGIELVRFYPRESNYRISNVTIDRNNNCWICQMAEGKGFSGAKQGDNLTLVPSIVAGQGQTRSADINASAEEQAWQDSTTSELSLDVRWGITPDILLNATINPDFSTIESDSAQLSINNNFALYNQEKRPFFLDNADYFETNYNLVYTRNINAPDYGTKVTGRSNNHSFGLFVANDDNTNILIPGNINSSIATIDEKGQNAVMRYRYDVDSDWSIGWISTYRAAGDYQNNVNGVDSKYRISTSDVVKIQVVHSSTEYPSTLFESFLTDIEGHCDDDDENCEQDTVCNIDSPSYNCRYNEQALRTKLDGKFTDTALRFTYHHNDEHWDYSLRYDDIGKNFRADMGFLNNTDRNQIVAALGRNWYQDHGGFWQKYRLAGDWDTSHNDNGEFLEKELEAWFTMEGQQETKLRFGAITRDRVGRRFNRALLAIDNNTDLFSTNEYRIFGEIKPWSGLYLNTDIAFGDRIDYANNRVGTFTEIRPNIRWNISAHTELNLRHTYRNLEADNSQGSDNVFIARLSDIKLTYQFDTNSFIRLNVILNNTNRNQSNYLYNQITEKYTGLASQLLYAYKFNAQTVFYAGYSDNGYSEQSISDIRQNERNMFIKFSYAWLK